MGAEVKRNNKKIFDAYLAVGAYLMRGNGNEPVSSQEITNLLDPIINDRRDASRIKDKIKGWFEDNDIRGEKIKEYFSTGPKGTILKNLPYKVKADLLGSFLWLLLIDDEGHRSHIITSLINKGGEDAYTIVTKLALAKNNGWEIEIELPNEKFKFKPKKIYLDNNQWIVEGNRLGGENDGDIQIKIGEIARIKVLSQNILQ